MGISNMNAQTIAPASMRTLTTDQRGALVLEYVVVAMVGLMIATALLGLGVAMVDAFGSSLQILYSEYP
jgi:Flp pilus assembly pilin Flp